MEEQPRNIIGLRRGLIVARFLAQHPAGATFSEIRARLGNVAPATVSRVLKVLMDEAWVEKRAERYAIGRAFRQAAQALSGALPAHEIIEPLLLSLGEQVNESVAYFELRGDRIMLLAKRDRENCFHHLEPFGTHRFFTIHAFSHVCIAYLPQSEWVRYYAIKNDDSPLTKREFMRRLKSIPGSDVYVYLHGGNHRTLHCIVAPVFLDRDRQQVGALGTTMIREPKPGELEAIKEGVAQTGRMATERIAAIRGYRAEV